jgi:hypothetical protein
VRVGTWVYAAPLRAPLLTAWEARSLTVLTEGLFEMGIGVGRPGIEDELREGSMSVPSPGQRLDQVRDTIASLNQLDGDDGHTPVAMAVIGPRARALATEVADIVTFVGIDSLADAHLLPKSRLISHVLISHVTAVANNRGFNGTENSDCKYPPPRRVRRGRVAQPIDPGPVLVDGAAGVCRLGVIAEAVWSFVG